MINPIDRKQFVEHIAIRVDRQDEFNVRLLLLDNGCGIPPDICEKLYRERCSDQEGKEHGLGGIIIKKLLELNNGNITIPDSPFIDNEFKTLQLIRVS